MESLASGIFGAGINWRFIFIGFGLAVVLIVIDKVQESRGSSFRFPVLAVAVGVYLPLGLSVPIFIGGLIAHFVSKRSAAVSAEVRQARENTGLLVGAGLITGEALMGVLVSVLAVVLNKMGSGLPLLPISPAWIASVLGLLGLGYVIFYQYRRTMNTG